jgi:hypothetical protein
MVLSNEKPFYRRGTSLLFVSKSFGGFFQRHWGNEKKKLNNSKEGWQYGINKEKRG